MSSAALSLLALRLVDVALEPPAILFHQQVWARNVKTFLELDRVHKNHKRKLGYDLEQV